MAEHNPLLRLWSFGFKALLLVILAVVAWPLALIWAVVGTILVVRDLREQAERRQALQHLVRPLAPPPQQPYTQWDAAERQWQKDEEEVARRLASGQRRTTQEESN